MKASGHRLGMSRTRPVELSDQEPDVAVAADLSKYLDKAYENKTLEEILTAPISGGRRPVCCAGGA